jgi:hypothetical protein
LFFTVQFAKDLINSFRSERLKFSDFCTEVMPTMLLHFFFCRFSSSRLMCC